jgi:predicted RNA-binding Zn-ribbon protein involved in translation (DUF1610 family)
MVTSPSFCYWWEGTDAINYYVPGCAHQGFKVSFDVEVIKSFSYCPNCGNEIKLTDECSTTH